MAMTIQELREKRAKAWDTARDFLDSKRNANGVLSEEDSKTYDAMEKTIVDLGKEIQRLERQAEIEAEMNKPTSTPVLGKPATPDVTERQVQQATATKRLSGTASEIETGLMSITTCTLAQMQRAVILFQTSLKENWWKHWRKKVSSVRWQRLSRLPTATARFRL